MEESKCKYWPPNLDEDDGVCIAGSEIGIHTCTHEDQLSCMWAKEEDNRRKLQ